MMLRALVAGAALIVVGFFAVGCGQVGPGERAVFVRWGVMEFRRLEVREKEIAKWNGVLPQTIVGGGGAIPLVSVGK